MAEKGNISSLKLRFAGLSRAEFTRMETKQLILDNLGSAVILFDKEGLLMDYNNEAAKLLDLSEDYIGVLSESLMQEGRLGLDAEYMEDGSVYEVVIPIGLRKHYFNIDFRRLSGRNGEFIGNLYHFHDVTTIKELYYQLENAATHDRVSGLLNKRVFDDKVRAMDKEENYPISVAVININSLSMINSLRGITEGDMMIKFVTEVLKTQLRAEDFAVRLDGETVIVMPSTTESQAVRLMRRVREMISLQVDFTMNLSIEFGVAVKQDPYVDINDILESARNTLKRKKMLSPYSMKNAIVKSLNTHFETMHMGMKGHPDRVRELTAQMCSRIGLNDEETVESELLAALHDIGLITIREKILKKNSSLNDEEWAELRKHPEAGYHIANINPELSSVASFILAHHERWDGQGYPNNLREYEIPIQARIVSICDAYDIMTHDTFYNSAMTEEEALSEIESCAGHQFDPKLAGVFVKMMREEADSEL